MAIFGNFKGTSQSSYQIGKNGAKIYGTPTRPSGDEVNQGDFWADSANSTFSSIFDAMEATYEHYAA